MKTLWQKVYSFFGFWTYTHHEGYHKAFLVVYWCMFPWLKFYRKIDLFRIDVSQTKSMEAERRSLVMKNPSILDIRPEWKYPYP